MSAAKSGDSKVSEHLTRNTEYDETINWRANCNRMTRHRRRPGETRGRCTEHDAPWQTKEQIARDAKANHNWRQRKLFP